MSIDGPFLVDVHFSDSVGDDCGLGNFAVWYDHRIHWFNRFLIHLLIKQDICTSHPRSISIESSYKSIVNGLNSFIINQHPFTRCIILDNRNVMTMVWSAADVDYDGIQFVESIGIFCVVGGVEESKCRRVYYAMEQFEVSLHVLCVLESF